MAENEEGVAEAAAPAPKGKLKLMIAVAVVLATAVGSATWFFFFRQHSDEMHAEAAPPPKPPSYVEVPDMLVNLVGLPGELNGSAGLFRLKEDLTRRVNAAVAPNQVSAVLFKEVVVQ